MKTIWKYDIPIEEAFTLDLPVIFRVLHIEKQNGIPKAWIYVDNSMETVPVQFKLIPTGSIIDLDKHKYLGTFQLTGLVLHLVRYYK